MRRKISILIVFILLLQCLLPLVSVRAEGESKIKEEILNSMTTREKVAQMMMPAFRLWKDHDEDDDATRAKVTELNDQIRTVIAENSFAGVILFGENNTSTEQTVALIDSIQKANIQNEERAQLLISVDQEGAGVSRLADGTQGPGNMALGATGDSKNANSMAKIMGSELNAIGYNVDFAPVVDVNNNPSNPVIGVRSFSDDANIVAEFGSKFMKGLKSQSVVTSLKHFPGHGDVDSDSHAGRTIVDKSYDELNQNELIPFKKCIQDGAEMIMTAHIEYPQIETTKYDSQKAGEEINLPATLSSKIIGEVLRDDLGFNGVVVTDAMNMGAIAKYFDELEAAKLAINAGVDIILMPVAVESPSGITHLNNYIDNVTALVESGEISIDKVNSAVMRILTLKENNGLLETYGNPDVQDRIDTANGVVGSKANHDKEWEIAKKSITLVKNDTKYLPIKNNEKTVILVPYANEVLAGEFAINKLKEDGIISNDMDISVYLIRNKELDEIKENIKDAKNVILITEQGSEASLAGANYTKADGIIDYVHERGNKIVCISCQLPYDVARLQKADSIMLAYSCKGMNTLPDFDNPPVQTYGVSIPCGIYTVFDKDARLGKLPVNIPKLNEDNKYTSEILYSRNYGLQYYDNASMSEQGKEVYNSVDSGTVTIDGVERKVVDAKVKKQDITNYGLNYAIWNALNVAYSEADPAEGNYIYRIIVPAGDYEVYGIGLNSNMILDLRNGANLYGSGCVIYSPDTGDGAYGAAENMMILGGSIHGLPKGTDISSHKANYSGSCTVRFGHCKNVNIVGTTIADNCGGHHVEVGAVKNLLVADCEFTGYADSTVSSNATSLEAIQLDVIHREKMNFAGYSPKDDYSIENATIVNNYFHGLRRGVGSHHAVYGHPYTNIKILNNKFDNILDKAIQIEYCKNVTISGNEINNATSGISFYSAFAGAFYLPNNETERTNAKNNFNNTVESNSVIENNKITLTTRAVYNESWADKSKYGIRIFGDEFTATNNKQGYESSTATLPPNGIFYVSGVTARNNTISTVNNEKSAYLECGIRVRYAKNCKLEKNNINVASASSVTAGAGINLLNTESCEATGNVVKNAFNGISVTGGKKAKVTKNEVNTTMKNGITVVDGSTSATIDGNTIKGVPGTCISVSKKSTISTMNNNVISGKFTHGISAIESSSIGTIKGNKITGGSKNGIAINGAKVTGKIESNTITSSGAYGIITMASANVGMITGNNISKTKKYGIFIYDKSTCKEFGSNKLTSCANKNKIYIASNAKGIALNKNSISVKKKKSYTIKVLAKAANSKKVTWSTSNKKIATVKNGKITGKKKGTATITVTQNGAKSKCKVTVK